MTIWVKEEVRTWKPATPEEIARVRAIMAEKSLPENIVEFPTAEVPSCYKGRFLGDSTPLNRD